MAHEGCILHPYNDSVNFSTVGVGHLINRRPVNEADKKLYANFTKQDAINLLHQDVSQFVKSVNALLIHPVSQNQFDAMVSLAFNVGIGNFSKSSVLRYTNAQKYTEASEAFMSWNKAGGAVVKGLTKRRGDEQALYLTKDVIQEVVITTSGGMVGTVQKDVAC